MNGSTVVCRESDLIPRRVYLLYEYMIAREKGRQVCLLVKYVDRPLYDHDTCP